MTCMPLCCRGLCRGSCCVIHCVMTRRQVVRLVVVQGVTLSYGELDERANQLAHRLVALGVGPEVPVGVMMERSLDLAVALLGVLKAGGAYVPMDPSYPLDRLALMMEDSEARSSSCSAHLGSSACTDCLLTCAARTRRRQCS